MAKVEFKFTIESTFGIVFEPPMSGKYHQSSGLKDYINHHNLEQTTLAMIGCQTLQPVRARLPRDRRRFLRPITIGICCQKAF
jgi:hypothetical protein